MTKDGNVWQWGWCNKGQTFAVPTQIALSDVARAPQCGTANGGSFATAPSANLCLIGTPSAVTGNGSWSWTCTGPGTQTTSCAAVSGPIFTLQPSGASVTVLSKVTLKALAVGKGAVTYQWYKVNSTGQAEKVTDRASTKGAAAVIGPSVSGSTTAQLTLVVAITDSGSYYVEARDGASGAITRSRTAGVTVKPFGGSSGKILLQN
jgi:hypothetical protein